MWNLRDILSLFFKRKWIVLTFFVTVVVGAFLVMKSMPPTYAAHTKMLVKVGREDIYVPALPSTEAVSRPMMSLIREEQLNSEVEIITSEHLVQMLVEQLSPTGIYPSMFIEHPWYTPKGIMQGAINLYQAIDGYFAPLSANLTAEQRAMKRLLDKDLVAVGTGDSNVIMVTVRNKIPELAAKTANALTDLYLRERGRIHSGAEGSVFAQQMQENEARLDEAQDALQQFREKHSLTDVSAQRDALLKRVTEVRSIIIDLRSQPSAALRLKKWQEELNHLEAQLKTLNHMELEFTRLLQDVEILTESRKVFMEKLEEYRINEALNSAVAGNVSVISKAVVPLSPVSPKLWMILLGVLVVGLFGGLGLAFLVEFFDDTLETDRDVEKYLKLRVLGKVPYREGLAAA